MVRRILAGAALVALVSCGGEVRTCTLIGGASAVSVGADAGVVVTDLCLDTLCHPIDFWDGRELIDNEPRIYTYELTVVIDGETRVLTGDVETREFWINGEGCDPKTANAHLHVAADGSVSVDWPPFRG